MKNIEFNQIITKLADIRDNIFNVKDMEAEGHGMEDVVADPYAVVCYIENKLKRQNEIIEKYGKALDDIKNISTLNEYQGSEPDSLLNTCFTIANETKPYKHGKLNYGKLT